MQEGAQPTRPCLHAPTTQPRGLAWRTTWRATASSQKKSNAAISIVRATNQQHSVAITHKLTGSSWADTQCSRGHTPAVARTPTTAGASLDMSGSSPHQSTVWKVLHGAPPTPQPQRRDPDRSPQQQQHAGQQQKAAAAAAAAHASRPLDQLSHAQQQLVPHGLSSSGISLQLASGFHQVHQHQLSEQRPASHGIHAWAGSHHAGPVAGWAKLPALGTTAAAEQQQQHADAWHQVRCSGLVLLTLSAAAGQGDRPCCMQHAAALCRQTRCSWRRSSQQAAAAAARAHRKSP